MRYLKEKVQHSKGCFLVWLKPLVKSCLMSWYKMSTSSWAWQALSIRGHSANWNETVASNCIIVENYFGCLTKLWGVISSKYRWSGENYDSIFCVCMALTNFHNSFHPLCEEENATHYHRYKNHSYMIGDKIAKNCKMC